MPFDCKGRNFLMKIIEDAEEFVYLCSERFTDKEFFFFLEKIRLKGITVKIFAKFASQDFQERIIKFAKDYLALGIEIKTQKNLHAKLVITDKLVSLGSINLNRMNLGFKKSKIPLRLYSNHSVLLKYINLDFDITQNKKKSFKNG
jgi:phosphatidylserine/phosphatidylglycerophosphate/cardiolipin synthase-like enzyme